MPENVMNASAVVAESVRELRKRRRWSVRELAERCAAAGMPSLTENALENIERDRSKSSRRGRQVSIDELFALALVFGEAPTALLMPSSYDVDLAYQITPERTEDPDVVRAWLDMRVPLDDVVKVQKRMQGNDKFASELRDVWFAEQNAYQQRVDMVRRVRAEEAGNASR